MSFLSAISLVLGLSFAYQTEVSTYKCGRDLVRIGDQKITVQAICGQPFDITYQTRVEVKNPGTRYERWVYIPVECWLYNPGSRRFFHTLTFEKGRLVGITRGSYGYDEQDYFRCGVIGNDLDKHDYQSVVLMKCGQPDSAESYEEDHIVRVGDREHVQVVRYDEWTYNFGPRKFMSILRFRNGVLVEVRKGDYGF